MAKGFRPVDRDQQFLMPPDMREWLPADHLVWFVLDVVERLDLTAFRARHRLGGVGHEAYDPAMLLALLIYAYAVGERSSRRIQPLCGTDVAFRVICAQDVPDHTTIARFRQAHVEAFDEVFAQVLRLCARAGMGRLSTVAIDGTKIAANASIDASHGVDWFREQARTISAQAAAVDAAEDAEFGADSRGDEVPAELADPGRRKARIAQILAEMEQEQAEAGQAAAEQAAKAEQHLVRLTQGPVTGRDPAGVDPVAAAKARLARELAVRQAEIDAYAAEVAAAIASGRRRPSGRRVADPFGGKAVRKALAALERALARAVSATQNGKNGKNGKVAQRNLTDPDSRILPTRKGWVQGYNAQFAVSADWLVLALTLTSSPADTGELTPMMQCTVTAAELINGERDAPEQLGTVLADAGYCSEDNLTAEGPDRLIATGKAHQLAQQATQDPTSGPPPEHATPIEAMRHRLRTPEGAALYKKRGATVETVNAHIKDRIGLRTFSMRGMTACLGELNLVAAVHNLRRLFTAATTTDVIQTA
ncbi:transposase [Lentzea aerocolonigenes]|uniref:transposase n=1 Tax=Lentzea aerocolonigenes TaxID=68170 RepID=UPI0004C2F329|nr:transposase [Lentzea aerocolonigenes]